MPLEPGGEDSNLAANISTSSSASDYDNVTGQEYYDYKDGGENLEDYDYYYYFGIYYFIKKDDEEKKGTTLTFLVKIHLILCQ